MIETRMFAPIGVAVREVVLTCDSCGATIATGASKRGVRKEAARDGYRRLHDLDLCQSCAASN